MPAVLCVGHAVQDFIFAVDEMPARAEKYRASAFSSAGGGPAASAAVTIARLAGQARLAARVGEDQVGDLIIGELEDFDVDCSLVRRFKNRTSSLSAVLIDSAGERLIVNYLDAELPVASDWLPKTLDSDVSAVLADTRWPQAAEIMLTRARQAGIFAILDADSPVPGDGKLLQAATHIAFSTAGLRDYAGHENFEPALAQISAETGAWCCVTLGGDGVLYTAQQQAGSLPAFSVRPVDTLGAGDVWHGAFALALCEGKSELDAMRFAAAAAALKVGRSGRRSGIPSREQVDQFLSAE